MDPSQLSRTVRHAVCRAVENGELRMSALPDRVVIQSPPRSGRGDYATNVAFRLSREAGRPVREVAEILRARLVREAGIAHVEIAGSGFLNITVVSAARAALVARIIGEGEGEEAGAGGSRRAVSVSAGRPRVSRSSDPLRDAARWAAAVSATATPVAVAAPTVPPELLVQRESNPLFRVQYAHARIQALCRNAHDLGFSPDPDGASYDEPDEAALLALLADHPRIGASGDSGRLARHLETVADAFFRFHDTHRLLPRGDEKPGAAHRSRMALARAAGVVLAGGLTQLGITAPAHL